MVSVTTILSILSIFYIASLYTHANVCNVADRTIQNVKTVESIHLHGKIDSFEYDRVLSKTAFFTLIPGPPFFLLTFIITTTTRFTTTAAATTFTLRIRHFCCFCHCFLPHPIVFFFFYSTDCHHSQQFAFLFC